MIAPRDLRGTWADGARVFAGNVGLLTRVGLSRPIALITALSASGIALAAIVLALEGKSTVPLLCLSLSVPCLAWSVRCLSRTPIGYVGSLVSILYCDVAITFGVAVVTSANVGFLKLAWLIAVNCYAFVFHGRIVMAFQSSVLLGCIAIVLADAARRDEASPTVLAAGAATVLIANAIAAWVIYLGKQQFARHSELASNLARLDELTGLLNRRGLAESCAGWTGAMTVAVLDLNGFKETNDRFGHAAGDELLRRVGRRLQIAAGEDALVARIGGDEFVVVAVTLPHDLVERVRNDADRIRVRASIGYAFGIAEPGEPSIVESLINTADAKMYRRKRIAARNARPAAGRRRRPGWRRLAKCGRRLMSSALAAPRSR